MPSRRPVASTTPCAPARPGFCIYNDVALAVAAARDAGHRVLYVDLDVHHGDGTQALFWDDPQVLTFSIHETGRSLFPGTGMIEETGRRQGARASPSTCPLDRGRRRRDWWSVVDFVLPVLAGQFKPTFIVSQHGCDSHALDPLAHLRVTTASYQRACALVDRLAHEHAEGRWLATGGGGYDAFRVVPRSWALVWLAQAHRDRRRRLRARRGASAGAPPPRPSGRGRRRSSSSTRRGSVAPDPDVIVVAQARSAPAQSLLQSLRLQATLLAIAASAVHAVGRVGGGHPMSRAHRTCPIRPGPAGSAPGRRRLGMRGLPTALVSMPSEWPSWWKVGPSHCGVWPKTTRSMPAAW